MSWKAAVIIALFLILLYLVATQDKKECTLEDINAEVFLEETSRVLKAFTANEHLKQMTLEDINWYIENHPDKIKRYFKIYKKLK